jgi:ubiquinone/menaquinone biosynthesis C-methylase UbiE
MRREEVALEWLDRPVPRADLDASLADVDRLNTWFGGHALTMRAIGRLLGARARGQRPAIVVDIGGGRGDLARRLVRRARRAGATVRVVVVDRDAESLALAGAERSAWPEILRVRADAAALPFRDGSVDVATSTLVLHHLPPAAAVASLAAMRAIARAGVVVNDLLRGRLAVWLVRVVTLLLARHPFARHDGPLSVRRAYSPGELQALCARAGWTDAAIRRYPLLLRVVAWERGRESARGWSLRGGRGAVD